jgi:NAD(P)-dependent dehydrogenase (short-subunit alcohol dehydrogenase family)
VNERAASGPLRAPDLRGRVYVVTGANAGLGYFASEQLARAGADVVMTGRNPVRLGAARAALETRRRACDPDGGGRCETLLLDTSNLGSVRAAAATLRQRGRIDGVLLNAGMIHPPRSRHTTLDGNELVFATNVLGHFALAGALLTTLAAARGRLVWLGSVSTSLCASDPVDPQLETRYSPWRAYVQSKVAATAIGLEADRRLREGRVPVQSIVAHPGYATSGRTPGIRGVNEPTRHGRFLDALQAPVSQSKEHGAWSLVRALTDPAVAGGELWGPRFVLRGAPRRARPPGLTRDRAVQERLWAACERAAQLRWPFEAARR